MADTENTDTSLQTHICSKRKKKGGLKVNRIRVLYWTS